MNSYYESIKFVESKLIEYLSNIYKVYGNELLLKLEDYNLLAHKNNCIETSTATGFILEEFITSKLEIYTRGNNGKDEIRIEKITDRSTIKSSYDCFAEYNNIWFLINVKAQKQGSQNNAVAAINILHKDYVIDNSDKIKSYIILKSHYRYINSANDKNRKIGVEEIETYALEECDFSNGHRQDHRNWSVNFNAQSGRLQISDTWRENHNLSDDEISHELTKKFVDEMIKE